MRKLLLSLSLVLILTISAFAQDTLQIPSNPHNHSLICIGNSSYMQWVDFKEAVDTSAVLKSLSELYHFQYVDPTDTTSKFNNLATLVNQFPCFILVDENDALLSVDNSNELWYLYGYDSPDMIIKWLSDTDTVTAVISNPEFIDKLANKKRGKDKSIEAAMDRMIKREVTEFTAGYVTSWLTSSGPFSGGSVDGISIALNKVKGVTRKMYLVTGLNYDILGGIVNGYKVKEHTLSIPVEAEFKLTNICLLFSSCQDLKFRAGVWGGVSLSSHSADMRRVNAGAKAELLFVMGSFDIHCGYMRGFINRFSSTAFPSAYTNAMTIGARIRFE